MPISSEEYHDKLNALLVETVTKMLRGESSTEGGTDWEDAEKFLALAAEHLRYEVSISAYPDGRLKISQELCDEEGKLITPRAQTDVAQYMNERLEDEKSGGKPDELLANYKGALERVIAELK